MPSLDTIAMLGLDSLTMSPTPLTTQYSQQTNYVIVAGIIVAFIFVCWCSYRFFGGRTVYVRPGDRILLE